MLYRNFILAKRLFLKYPLNSFITLGGLVLGLAAFILAALFVYDEYKTDKFHSKYESIYLIKMTHYVNNERMFTVPPPTGFKQDLDGISEIVSNSRAFTAGESVLKIDEEPFYENGGVFVDSSFLEIFDFRYANQNFSFLTDPTRIALSEKLADKYFGKEDAVGREIIINDETYVIDNLILNSPGNASFEPSFLISYLKQKQFGVDINAYDQGHTPFWIYAPTSDYLDELKEKLQSVISEKISKDARVEITPLKEYYFEGDPYYSHSEASIRGNKKMYNAFIWVACLVLSLAIVNYINLNTARATDRAKEVGIKKTIGVRSGKLVVQFLVESVSLTLLAGLLAIGVAELCLPFLNQLLTKPISQSLILTPEFLFSFVLLLLVVGILAGLYPALVLSSFKPSWILKGRLENRGGTNWLRNSLTTFQFTIAAVLIFSCLVINSQMHYLTDFDLGIDSDRIISIKTSEEVMKALPVLKKEIQNLKGVENVSTGDLPGLGWMYGNEINGNTVSVVIHHVEEDFLATAGINLLEGRNFEISDDENAVIINKTLRDFYFGEGETSFGQLPNSSNVLIGVVEDFYISSAANEMRPLELKRNPSLSNHILVRVAQRAQMRQFVTSLKEVFNENAPNSVFDYSFLDDEYDIKFKSEIQFLKLLNYFTYLSVFIGFIGLFGLGQFSFLKKIRELSIRKVLGASSASISKLMVYQLFKPVIIAILISLPLGYILLDKWLMAYSNKIELNWQFGLITVLIITFIALLAIIYQLINASRLKPVNVLKDE